MKFLVSYKCACLNILVTFQLQTWCSFKILGFYSYSVLSYSGILCSWILPTGVIAFDLWQSWTRNSKLYPDVCFGSMPAAFSFYCCAQLTLLEVMNVMVEW